VRRPNGLDEILDRLTHAAVIIDNDTVGTAADLMHAPVLAEGG
jgi:hypothetical protein